MTDDTGSITSAEQALEAMHRALWQSYCDAKHGSRAECVLSDVLAYCDDLTRRIAPPGPSDALRTLTERVTERREMWRQLYETAGDLQRVRLPVLYARREECDAVLSLIVALDTGDAPPLPDATAVVEAARSVDAQWSGMPYPVAIAWGWMQPLRVALADYDAAPLASPTGDAPQPSSPLAGDTEAPREAKNPATREAHASTALDGDTQVVDEPDTFGLPAMQAMGHAPPESPDEQDTVPDGFPFVQPIPPAWGEGPLMLRSAQPVRLYNSPEVVAEIRRIVEAWWREQPPAVRVGIVAGEQIASPVPLAMLPLTDLARFAEAVYDARDAETFTGVPFDAARVAAAWGQGEGDGDAG